MHKISSDEKESHTALDRAFEAGVNFSTPRRCTVRTNCQDGGARPMGRLEKSAEPLV
jgi:hypothetical protein